MLFHSLLEESSTAYFEQSVFSVKGDLDVNLLNESYNIIIDRYDILRTSFVHKQLARPRQVVLKARPIKIEFIDVSYLPANEAERWHENYLKDDRANKFNLTTSPLSRLHVIKTAANTSLIIWCFHHIIMDGWCLGILFNEVLQVYAALKSVRTPALPAVAPYQEYIEWLEKQNKEKAVDFWKNSLAGYEQEILLPGVLPRFKTRDYQEESYQFELDKRHLEQVKKICSGNKNTINDFFTALWGVLLQKYNNAADVVFGTVVSGRPPAIEGIENMVGLFINTIPVRVKSNEEQLFTELLTEVHKHAQEARSYDYLPLTDIQGTSLLRQELVNHLLVFENHPFDENINEKIASLGIDFCIEDIQVKTQTNYNFNIIFLPGESFQIKFLYNANYVSAEGVKRIASHFQEALLSVIENHRLKLKDINILPDAERELILTGFNTTKTTYPNQSISALFEEQVVLTPHQLALVSEEKSFTYFELNEKANQLAHLLQSNYPILPEEKIGVIVEKDEWAMIVILAVLKTGAAYVPIDPTFPQARIDFMVEDCGLNLTIIAETYKGYIPACKVLLLEDQVLAPYPSANLGVQVQAGQLAYVMYTSGSTGRAKGVLVEQKSVVSLVKNTNFFQFKPGNHILQTGAFTFDATTFEYWGALLNGGALYMISEDKLLNPTLLHGMLENHRIHVLFFTTGLFNRLIEQKPEIFTLLDCILVGGEVLSPRHMNEVRKRNPSLKVVNVYGPTENTTFSTYYPIHFDFEHNIPIGRSTSNSTAYIFDRHRNLLPIGVAGELCLGGDGLAREYLNRDELTNEKFIPHPFLKGERLYCTGDLARWLPDGNLEFLGRIDEQVKIRGYRIEPEEIVLQLEQHPAIKQAQVIAKDFGIGQKELAAYLIPEDETQSIESASLRMYLGQHLPTYMIPSYFVCLLEFPLNVNGKIDRKLLPLPVLSSKQEDYVAPRNATEESLAELWKEVLLIERPGTNDNFFDLGGHSLKALMLVSRISKVLNVELSLKEIFNHPSISQLAEFMDALDKKEYISIPLAPPDSQYPLSDAQRRLWIIDNLEPGNAAYHIPVAIMLKGSVDEQKFLMALQKMMERHEVLRTSFDAKNGQPFQKIHETIELPFSSIQSDIADEIQACESLKQEVGRTLTQLSDLRNAPLWHICLHHFSGGFTGLTLVMHHIISDGWSMGVMIREVSTLYFAAIANKSLSQALPPLSIQYKDFSAWQNKALASASHQQHLLYWKQKLSGELPVTEIPADFPRPTQKTYKGQQLTCTFTPEVSQQLKTLSQNSGSTLFMTLTAMVKTLIYHYSGQKDLLIGTPVAGRNHPDLENQIGFYVNTVVLRTQLESKGSFNSFLNQVKKEFLEAHGHQDFPYDRLVDELELKRDLSRNPLFDIMVVFQNQDESQLNFGGLDVYAINTQEVTSQFDVTFVFSELTDQLQLNIVFNTDLYRPETFQRLWGHFTELATSVTADPHQPIGSLNILSRAEEQTLLHDLSGPVLDFPGHKTLMDLFEEQVQKTPDQEALLTTCQGNEMRLSFKELDMQANQLANFLKDTYQLKPDELVGIMLPRTEKLIIALLAVLKAGAAYVPIDPAYPKQRIGYMLEDSKAKLLISDTNEIELLTAVSCQILEINEPEIWHCSPAALERQAGPGNLAYIIYTSGSTGNPKGVAIEQANAVSFLYWCHAEFQEAFDIMYASTSVCFDLSIFEIFYPLCFGRKIRLIESGLHIAECIHKDQRILINTVPSVAKELVALEMDWRNVKMLNMAGESIPQNLLLQLKNKTLEVRNLYGPSEYTTYTTTYLFENYDKVLIGKPLANTQIYILSEDLKLLPQGCIGELWVSGAGIARGYLHKPELTRERFLKSPFDEGRRIYKTGDLGRWTADGNIEYLGRKDQQLKIRGYRIELGEVEISLLKHQDIEEAIVMAVGEEGQKELAAFITGNTQEKDPVAIKAFLKELLPGYMVPSYIIPVESLPLTPNGKIDKLHLQLIFETEGNKGKLYEPPNTEPERVVAALWASVLGKKHININENFFEAGGNSLKAMRLVSGLSQKIGAQISLKEIFSFPTVKEMANLLVGKQVNKEQTIASVPFQESYEVSHAQRRLFIIESLQESSAAYHIPIKVRINGVLDVQAFSKAFEALVRRHEVLRTYFVQVSGQLKQVVLDQVEVKLPIYTFSESTQNKETHIQELVQPFYEQKFNLRKAPLFYARLLELNPHEFLFLFNMHHIISDGWSLEVLFKDLDYLYAYFCGRQKAPIASLLIQYKDYSHWQNNFLKGDAAARQQAYWKEKLTGPLPQTEIAADYPRPVEKTYEGKMVSQLLPDFVCEKFEKLQKESKASWFMTFTALVKTLLCRYVNQQNFVIGTPVAGRHMAELQDQIGFYVNTLVLRTEVDENETFLSLLEKVKKSTTEALEHQDYPFDKLVDDLSLAPDISRNPLFEIMINVQEDDLSFLDLGGHSCEILTESSSISKFDLSFSFTKKEESWYSEIIYNTNLYKESTIHRLQGHLVRLAQQIVGRPDAFVTDFDLLLEEEHAQLLQGFNNTGVAYQKEKNLIDLFHEQVKRSPDKVALEDSEGNCYTYQQLDERSSQLANYLLTKYSILPDQPIAMMMERYDTLIIGIYAILKTGGAYLPISTDTPESRVRYILEDSQTKLLLTNTTLGLQYNDFLAVVDLCDERVYSGKKDLCEQNSSSSNLAYIIYTSGSTGKPKGVLIEHHSVINRISWMQKAFLLVKEDVIIQKTPYTFDVSVWEIFWWAWAGAKVYLPQPGAEKDPEALTEMIEQKGITCMHFVPSMLNAFLGYVKTGNCVNKLSSLKQVFASGEALVPQQVNVFNELLYESNHTCLINLYGPTEATVDVSFFPCSPFQGHSVPIGKPIDNTRLYVMGSKNRLQPIGVAGELCIAGVNLARNYLNREALSKEKFCQDPFYPQERMYRTGDLARWLEDGNIEYLGRMDHQVKIRGYRIELGEIENRLQEHAMVKQAVVLASNIQGMAELIAFIVPLRMTERPENSAIKSYLLEFLPEYMVPGHFTIVEELPLSSSGKADRTALVEMFEPAQNESINYTAPRTPLESLLADLWAEVLGTETVGVHDNFFEIGGNSISAIKIVSLLQDKGYKLRLSNVFLLGTIDRIALILEGEELLTHDRTLVDQPESKSCHSASGSVEQVLEEKLKEVVEQYQIPGAIAGLYYEEKKIIKTIGYSDPLSRMEMHPQSQFRIGSITKTFVAEATLLLVQQGAIKLDDTLDHHYKSSFLSQEEARSITIRDLLQYTSGITDYAMNPDFLKHVRQAPEQEWDRASLYGFSHKIAAGKNKIWNYSNTNYLLLGEIIEKVTGASLAEVIESTILQPNGLSATSFPLQYEDYNTIIRGYKVGEHGFKPSAFDFHPSGFWGTGNMVSSAEDLLTWSRVISKGENIVGKLQKERTNWLNISDYFPHGADVKCGLGIFSMNASLGHIGRAPEFSVLMMHKQEMDFVLVVNRLLSQDEIDVNIFLAYEQMMNALQQAVASDKKDNKLLMVQEK